MQDFTPTELFARCSGDWDQIQDCRGWNVGWARNPSARRCPPRASRPLAPDSDSLRCLIFYLGHSAEAEIQPRVLRVGPHGQSELPARPGPCVGRGCRCVSGPAGSQGT
eukprot:4201373-Pyramimonas_sp.AAC.2